jgi:hypothetical protein
MSYDHNGMTHNEARAQGQFVSGPYKTQQGKMVVRTVTRQDIEFADEVSALRHMRSIGKKDPTTRVLVNARRLKHVWANDD